MDRNLTLNIVGGTELLVRKGSVTYGLGADISLPHCLSWVEQVSESSKGPGRRIGISDARVEISGFIVMVQRSGIESRGTATGSVIFL